MMNANWNADPRIRQLDPEKIAYLAEFAGQIASLPRSQALSAFLAMQLAADRKNIRFSDRETELIVSVLSDGMSPGEKKQLEALRSLAQKLAARKPGNQTGTS